MRKVLTALLTIAMLMLLVGCGDGSLSGGSAGGRDSTVPATESVEEPALQEPEEPALTTGQEQAVESAQGYLDMGGFSRAGLIDQLVYEGFTRAQAEHGVNAVY